ncbi:MAG: hypothetical protein ACFCVA_10895 [Gammaproteobacteria bacterium]
MLSTALHKLSEQALQVLKQHVRQPLFRTMLVRRSRPTVQRLEYDRGHISLVLKPHFVERSEWPLTDQYRFVNQAIKPLSSYSYCLATLEKSFGIGREHIEPRLTRYLQVLVATYFDEQDNSIVTPFCQRFLQDLEGVPIRWVIKGAIRGVILETEQFRFGKYLLRRPVAEDFEVEQAVEDGAAHPLQVYPPSAFLEFETRAPDHHGVRREYSGILNLLRLFRIGSIRSVALVSKPDSIIQSPGTLYSFGAAPAPYGYSLRAADQTPLGRFLENHLFCVARLDTAEDIDAEHAFLCLAYKTYTLALLDHGHAESGLLLALACLEGLLLRHRERSEVGAARPLGRRLKSLLLACGALPDSVEGSLQQAYDVRKVRGRSPAPGDVAPRSLTRLSRTVLNYVRIALVAFAHTADSVTHDRFIEILDGGSGAAKRLLKNTDVPL